MLRIDIRALALLIGAKRTSLVWTFIPVQSEPVQAIINHLASLFGIPLLVGILNSQYECPTMLAGVEPIKKGGPGSPYVKVSGR
jgi:hypothetical protein